MNAVGPFFGLLAAMALIRWLYRKIAEPKRDENWVINYLERRDQEKRDREQRRSTKYRVERVGSEGEGIMKVTRYRICNGERHIADFAHDFRLDENWFEIGGQVHDHGAGLETFPLDWGPDNPIHVTKVGEERLDRLLAKLGS